MSEAEHILYMKHLIPQGKGGFYVIRVIKNTEEGKTALRDALLAAGDWADATPEEYDNFLSAAEAVGEIAGNLAEWVRVEGLSDEKKRLIRKIAAGDTVSIEDFDTPEAGTSEAGA